MSAFTDWAEIYRGYSDAELASEMAMLRQQATLYSQQAIGNKSYSKDLTEVRGRLQAATRVTNERSNAHGGGSGLSGAGIFSFTLSLAGNVTAGQLFGFYALPANAQLIAASLDIQSPDAQAGVTVQLVDAIGEPYGGLYAVNALSGVSNASADFSASPLSLAANSVVRGRIFYAPSNDPTAPAQFLTVQVTGRSQSVGARGGGCGGNNGSTGVADFSRFQA